MRSGVTREEILLTGNVHVINVSTCKHPAKKQPSLRVIKVTGSSFLVVNKNLVLILLFGLSRRGDWLDCS